MQSPQEKSKNIRKRHMTPELAGPQLDASSGTRTPLAQGSIALKFACEEEGDCIQSAYVETIRAPYRGIQGLDLGAPPIAIADHCDQ